MSNKNEITASQILTEIGGEENITSVTHCATRLRLVLKDQSLPNTENIKKIPQVVGVVSSGGQFQIIIGQNVSKVYEEFCKLTGEVSFDDSSIEEEAKSTEKLTLKGVGRNIMNYLAGCMTPMIPVMITAALFKTTQVVLGPNMLHLITENSDLYKLFDLLYSAFFYFLPVYLGRTAAKKLGTNEMLGMFIGCMLIAPTFVDMVTKGSSFTVYSIPCIMNNYSQTILPVVLSVWVMYYVERLFKKIVPDMLDTVLTPFLTMVVMVPVSFCILAPAGSVAGNLIGHVLVTMSKSQGILSLLAIALIGGFWEFLVMTGMHVILMVFMMTAIAQNGMDSVACTAATIATFAAYGMSLGAFLRLKNKEEKAENLGYVISGLLGGVSEPSLYGTGFRYKRPFIAMIIGGAAASVVAGIIHVEVYFIGTTNVLTPLMFAAGGTANIIKGTICCLISLFLTAALTYILGFNKEDL